MQHLSLRTSLPPSRNFRRCGSTLVITMMVVAVIASCLGIAALTTSQFGRTASRQQSVADAVAGADSALEYVYAAWKQAIVAKGFGAPTAADLSSITLSTAQMIAIDPGLGPTGANLTFNQRAGELVIDTVDQNGVHQDPVMQNGVKTILPAATQNVPNYPGWQGNTYYYKVLVTVQAAGRLGGSTPEIHLSRFFQLTTVPMYQAAIFYENDLEIVPGLDFVVTGLVHSNANIYAQGFAKLQFMSNVSYVGNFIEKANPAARYGWDGYNYGLFPASTQQVTWANGQLGASSAQGSQLNQVPKIDPFGGQSADNNGLHALIEDPTKSTSTVSSAISQEQIYNNASLIISVDSSKNQNDPNRVVATGAKGLVLTSSDQTAIAAAIGTRVDMQDLRENATMAVTPVDMSLFNSATLRVGDAVPTGTVIPTGIITTAPFTVTGTVVTTTGPGTVVLSTAPTNSLHSAAFNGAVYIQDVSKQTSRPAIRLQNASSVIHDSTFATPQPMYIKGDFNTGGVPDSDGAGSAATANTSVANYNRVSVAVMADAVTILSGAWNDSKSSDPTVGNRQAVATTINAAIMAGDVQTNVNNNGTASGGAHNLIRYLENWNNVNFTYQGSLVEAYRAVQSNAKWQTGNVYTWPSRRLAFDSQFLLRPPPGTPTGLQYSRGRWVRN